jgi:calcineurin-like phosphoesterase family protein
MHKGVPIGTLFFLALEINSMGTDNKVFVIADTHFGHKGVIEFEATNRSFSSVEEHDEELVRRWNSVVRKHDTVWHLGDVLFGADSFETLTRLNGVKKLILGNHDSYPTNKYLKYFNAMYGSFVINGYVLTHIPIHPSQFTRFKGNLHGHLHSGSLDDPRYICVSAEHLNLTPVLMSEVCSKPLAIK